MAIFIQMLALKYNPSIVFRILNSRNLFGESDDIKYKSYGNIGGRARSRRDRDPLSGYASSASYLQGNALLSLNPL